MFATVYWHHACRSAVAMLLRAVQEALGSEAVDPTDLEGADDASLVAQLQGDAAPDLSRDLAARIVNRRLYKRAAEVRVDAPSFGALERLWFRPGDRAATEDGWASDAGAPAGAVLLDIPEPKRLAEGLPLVVADGEASEWDRISGIGTDDLDRFQTWVRKIRVFASGAELAERVGPRVEERAA
jgi:HD superfamily phosphohydrolase